MKSISITILDSLFSAFLAFVLGFILLNFYIEKPYSIIISISLSVPIFMLAYSKLKNSSNIKNTNKLKSKAMENTFYALSLMEKTQSLSLIEKAISRLGYRTLKRKNAIFIDDKKVAIFPLFSFDGITKTDVVKVFNSIPTGFKAYILGEKVSAEIQDFIDRFDDRIEFVGIEKVYDFLKSTASLPEEKYFPKRKKIFENGFLSTLLLRKNAKKFLSFGSLFLIMSYFVPIKIYYLISGCVFLTLALFCRLYGKTKS